MQRYFIASDVLKANPIELPKEVVHHIGTVLRESAGYRLILLDGSGMEYVCEVISLEKKEATAKILHERKAVTELPVEVTLAYALPKGDKVEWVAQKSTELGLHHLILFESKRSVAKWDAKKVPKKLERLQKIMLEAAEQSYRGVRPTCQYKTPRTLLSELSDYDAVVIAYEESAKQGEQASFTRVIKSLVPDNRILIIVGPEGGFDQDEVDVWIEAGAVPCAFGPRILRTETAPLYALSSLSYALELN